MGTRQSVVFTEPQLAWLRVYAKKLGITVSDVVRRLVDDKRIPDRFHECCGAPNALPHLKICPFQYPKVDRD